jgi:SPASM domain peptide maturase of grasp-with-spasm system
MKKFLRLYGNCKAVKGARRSIICDLQYQSFIYIPNALFDILIQDAHLSVEEIMSKYPEHSDTIREYIDYLLNKRLAWICDESEIDRFPDMSEQWDVPSRITNAILDIGKDSSYPITSVINELELLGCRHLQFRIYGYPEGKDLYHYLDLVRGKWVSGLELIIPFEEGMDPQRINDLLREYPVVISVVIHGSPQEFIQPPSGPTTGAVIFTEEPFLSHHHCGVVSPFYFYANVKHYTESLAFNNCLNRKIGVDAEGNIKNCPSMANSFGKAGENSLAQIIDIDAFRKPWGITKDEVEICRDCEFRYICTDCRAYTQDVSNPYSKPAKCGYDPYFAQWNEIKELSHETSK